jgi:hypothetical protein
VNDVRATVFGLDVLSDAELPFLAGTSAAATGRTLAVSSAPGGGEPAPREGFEPLCDQRQPDGTIVFRIDAHPEAGYLLWGPGYGSHLLSSDGRRLSCAVAQIPPGSWQRLLVAQVLPFAAVLGGLEVFHASAVAIGGQAVAFLGPSHAGKTSLALELCRRGAGFLADDVLALEHDGEGRLLGHPGTPVAGLDRDEAERVGVAAPAVLASNARELLVQMDPVSVPTALAALLFLDRRPDGPARPRFEPLVGADALLSATFNFLIDTPERLSRLLDVCALAAQGRIERVLVGPGIDASELAGAVLNRLGLSP